VSSVVSSGQKTSSSAEDDMQDYKKLYRQMYDAKVANGSLAAMSKASRRALMECAGLVPERPHNCGRISSHAGWYRGKWHTDTCECGHKFGVPKGKRGYYRCDCCANRDW